MHFVCILANSADPDAMPLYAAFYFGLHFCQSTCLLLSIMKRVKTSLPLHSIILLESSMISRIEISVPRIIVWHHEAYCVMTNSDPDLCNLPSR